MVKALIILILAAAIFGIGGYFTYQTIWKPDLELEAERTAPDATPLPPPPDPSLPEFKKVRKIKEEGDLLAARDAYLQFIDRNPYSTVMNEAKKDLGEINTDIFFSQVESPEKTEYIVKSGDTLIGIASKTGTTTELIMRSNDLESIRINIGDRYLIPQPDFSMTIDREKRTVTLLDHGNFFKEYAVQEWKVPTSKSNAAVQGKVSEKIAWKDGKRLRIEDPDYAGSARWVMTSVPGLTLYAAASEGIEVPASDIPPTGLGMAFPDMDEIAVLVRRGTPITIK